MRPMYGCRQTFSGVPRSLQTTPTATTFPKIFNGLLFRLSLYNYVRAKFEVRSFTRGWDNRGYPKKLGSLWICPRSLFSKIFNGLLFGFILWMYWPILKSVAFPVPEIIGGARKKLGSSWIRPRSDAPFSPKFLMGFCSDGPSECTAQIWNP